MMNFSVSCSKCGTYRSYKRLRTCNYCHGPVLCWLRSAPKPAPQAVTEMFARAREEAEA